MKRRLREAWLSVSGFAFRHRTWLWRAGAVAGGAFIVLLLHRAAYSVLTQSDRFKVRPAAQVRVAPAWSGAASTVELPADLSLLDDGLVARLAERFAQNPWVRSVTSVERVFPDRVRLTFETRRPHVAVRRPDGLVVLDEDGVRLPGVYPAAPACRRSIEIAGVRGVPPEAGQRWTDADVAAGLELVELVSATPALTALGVRAVDVTNLGGRADPRLPDTALAMASGCTLYWGRTPSQPQFGEPTPAEKLASLAWVTREYPKLEGLGYVKLQAGGRAAVMPATQPVTVRGRRTSR